jgi:hypothetical protein
MPMKLRRCLIALTGGTVVALSAVVTPALASTGAPQATAARPAHAAPGARAVPRLTPATVADLAHPRGPAKVNVVIGGVTLDCFGPGIIYSVSTTGIHVRQLPNGSVLMSIGKGRWFDSNIYYGNEGPYHCITAEDVAGQQWVYGFPNYDQSVTGYVGLDYLYFVKDINY